MKNRRMKPQVFKGIVVTGVIGTYTAAMGLWWESPIAIIAGSTAALIMAVVAIDEDAKIKRQEEVQ